MDAGASTTINRILRLQFGRNLDWLNQAPTSEKQFPQCLLPRMSGLFPVLSSNFIFVDIRVQQPC